MSNDINKINENSKPDFHNKNTNINKNNHTNTNTNTKAYSVYFNKEIPEYEIESYEKSLLFCIKC